MRPTTGSVSGRKLNSIGSSISAAHFARVLQIAAATLSLTAAGAAASTHETRAVAAPSAPHVTLTAAPRKLQIQWSAVTDARFYLLHRQRTANSSYELLTAPLPASRRQVTLPLSAHQWTGARYFVSACNTGGCTPSAAVSATEQLKSAVEIQTSEYEYHEPTNQSRNQQYGMQVALSGDGRTMAVADIWYFGGSEWPWYGSGAVYVYRLATDGWILQAKLEPSDARGYDFFGSDVALSSNGGVLVVGAQNEGYDAPSQDAGPGSAFVYRRRGNSWTLETTLRASRPQDSASFGRSVEISAAGDVIAVGAPYESIEAEGTLHMSAGATYIYARAASGWSESAALTAPDPQGNDLFGWGVRLSENGRTVAVLAAEQNYATEDFLTGTWPNRNNTLYVFDASSTGWNLSAQFEATPDDPMFGGSSYELEGQAEGFDLSADGRALAVASPMKIAVDGAPGLVRLYRRSTRQWTAAPVTLTPALPERRSFGLRLTLSADGRMLAAYAARDDGVYGHPYVVVFQQAQNAWAQSAILESPGTPNASGFANSLALSWSGTRLAIGARSFATPTSSWGAVLVY